LPDIILLKKIVYNTVFAGRKIRKVNDKTLPSGPTAC